MPREKTLPLRKGIPCFSCGLLMLMLDDTTWCCDGCQVMEEHKNYVSHLREKSASWWGSTVYYVDHGKKDYPSPA